jgi:hypothetical protein
LANELGLGGAFYSLSITCSSALMAVLNAIAWMKAGMINKFIVGGSEAACTPFTIGQLKALRIYSKPNPEERWPCRPFDKDRPSGLVLSEAAAVMAFAFEERSLVLDINIRRLFSRVYDGVQSPTAAPNKAERAERAELVPKKNAHVWAAATMELGALICTAQKPRCEICPVADACKWRSLNYPQSDQPKRTQAWNGTDRQCRGIIVQALRENDSLSEKEIKKLWALESQVEKALKTLLADGLISQSARNKYSLPN